MAIALLSIGTELLRGEIENTNASWLCREAVALGASVSAAETVGDDVDTIARTLSRLGQTHSFIVCTGGLGPTTDDLTSLAVGRCLGVGLVRDAASFEHLRARYEQRGFRFSESNQKQCDFPEGAQVLANDWGTAPGFCVKIGQARAFFFPGVPREMQPMFERYVRPALVAAGAGHTSQIRVRTYGAAESSINDQLQGIAEQFAVTIGYRAHFPEIDVKPLATRDDEKAATLAVRNAADAISGRLGPLVYGEGEAGLAEVVIAALRSTGKSLGLAESCTGGLVASLLTAHSCSDVFVGGVVSYANAVKSRLLGVSAESLAREGAVSEATVQAMAQGAADALGCDLALAISGIAGPTGGTTDKPVGLVHFALGHGEEMMTKHVTFPFGDRVRIQLAAAYYGLNLVRLSLLGN
jgi:nicotinamide-nucleotide amidase